jgi:hypothetical protein
MAWDFRRSITRRELLSIITNRFVLANGMALDGCCSISSTEWLTRWA